MNVSMRRVVLGVLGAVLLPSVVWAGELSLTIRDGRVSLVARDVTVRQILAEWGRVGHTRIVNMEKVPGGPVTLEFRDLPESQALRVILRSVAGFMAAPRAEADPALSKFDRIVVMATLAAPAAPSATGPSAQRSAQPSPSLLPPGFRATQQQGLGEGFMGRPRRVDATGEPEHEGDADETETAADDFRQQQLGRPPLGMRPPAGPPTLPQGGEPPVGNQPPQLPITPGVTTPGSAVSKPGMAPVPPKPPGDSR